GGIPRLVLPLDPKTDQVRRFYEAAPFPGYSPREDFAALRARGQRSDFARQLNAAIPPRATVLELGCGTGQMSLFLANGERRVVAADLARASLELGAEASRKMGIRGGLFVETDLRRPGLPAQAFDVIICLGVLHHPPHPAVSFSCLSRLVRSGGLGGVGLYIGFARFPHRLRRGLSRPPGFRFFPMDPVLTGRAAVSPRREAWFGAQSRPPEEHRHTV